MEKWKASTISLNKVLGLPDIPPVAHEFAALLQFDTSYELVDWLAERLQFASDLLAQEHKDQEMIQKAMLGDLELEEERELQRIGWQRDVKNRGTTIQIPPLNTSLVEVHQELARTTRAAKDMVEVCKKAIKASNLMHIEWSTTKKNNEELSA